LARGECAALTSRCHPEEGVLCPTKDLCSLLAAANCGFLHEINFPAWAVDVGLPLQTRPDLDQIIFLDASEILVQRGFRENVFRKIWFSKNLDIKI
jgi:hypothetical protein